MMIRVVRIEPSGQTFTIHAEAEGRPLRADLPYVPGESPEACRSRVRRAVLAALGHQDRQAREDTARRLHAALDGLTINIERPWDPVFCELHEDGRILCGHAAEPSHDYFLVIREPDGTERDCLVTTDRYGRFSVDLGEGRRAIALTPVGLGGLLGAERRLSA